MYIVTHRRIWYGLSVVLIVLSLVCSVVFGLRLGIDFTGGSLLEVSFSDGRPSSESIAAALEAAGVSGASVRPTGESGYLIRTPFMTPDQYQSVRAAVGGTEVQYVSIGPTIGQELTARAFFAIGLVLLMITLFIAFAFRKVSKPVSSWKYGVVALLALAHDVILPVGAFALLGHFFGAEIDTLFVTALLVILGFSIHDTIVVFDRTRENLRILAEKGMAEPFETTVGRSIMQTLGRSINTSLTTALALVALMVWGPESIRLFSLTLLIGIVAGTYSSIFLASPLLVTWHALLGIPEVQKKQ